MKDKIKSEVLSKKIKNTWKQSFLKEKSNQTILYQKLSGCVWQD